MAKGNLEISLPELYLTGELYAEVYEQGGARPTTIIRTDQDWGVKIHWDLKGSLAPLICGEWCVHLCLESIGPGPELRFDHPHIPLNPCGDGEYNVDFRIPRGKIKGRDCSYPYKLVVTVTYLTACEKPGPIAGFVEGPILQFYDPDGKPIYYETERTHEE